MTFSEVRKSLRNVGITIKRTTAGEFRINFAEGPEGPAYYATDLGDAYQTGLHMTIGCSVRVARVGR